MLINDLKPYIEKISIIKEMLVNDILNDKYLTKLEKIILICNNNLYPNGWCRKELYCNILNSWLEWIYNINNIFRSNLVNLYEIYCNIQECIKDYLNQTVSPNQEHIVNSFQYKHFGKALAEQYPTNEDLVNHIYDVMIMDKISTLNLSNY